jgi:hypothetical protein
MILDFTEKPLAIVDLEARARCHATPRTVVLVTNTGMVRGCRPATIRCRPMRLTIAIDLFCGVLAASDLRSPVFTNLPARRGDTRRRAFFLCHAQPRMCLPCLKSYLVLTRP